jgi:hypothetical protein
VCMKNEPLNRYKLNKVNKCWEWIGCLNSGYGEFMLNGKKWRAHRYFYEHYKGKIPEGLHIDHLCSNKKCVNPDHLEAVTPRENNRRAQHIRLLKRVTCPYGHPLYGENLYIAHNKKGMFRNCKICKRASNRKYYWNKLKKAHLVNIIK